jgi:transcription antitermination factor NusG
VVRDKLFAKSIENYLPRVLVKSKRRDRKKMIRVPLFSGYIFVKTSLDPYEHLEILKTTGTVRLIGNRNGPVPVPDETIESLKIMVSTDAPLDTGNRFKPGSRIVVVSGPFAGVVGTFDRYGGKGRVIVNIEALGQYVSVEVKEDEIEGLPEILT